MFISRVSFQVSKSVSRSLTLLSASQRSLHLPTLSNQFHSIIRQSPHKPIPVQANLLYSPINSSWTPRSEFSSSASSQPNEKQHDNGSNPAKTTEEAKAADQAESSGTARAEDGTKELGSFSESQSQTVRRRRGSKRTAFSDSDSESADDLSRDDLVKLVAEKEELLELKQKEMEKMQDKVLRTYAEMENVMDRTRREAENAKKFAIQNFAKSLLDVADNLGRASSIVKESFSKIDTTKDSVGAVPLLKTLLEGVEMTEKQLAEIFKKFGLEKFDPTNEPFDPHKHNAVFQVPDGSKPPGSVAAVLKAGYMLYDRVIRPAEVGVTQAVENNSTTENDKGSQE